MNKKHFRKDRMTCMALQPCTYQSKNTDIFLKKKNDNTNNTSTSKDKFATYYPKVSNVLKEDNILKQLFYSNPDITDELVTFENKTYYGLSDKYNIKDVSEIYTKINKTKKAILLM